MLNDFYLFLLSAVFAAIIITCCIGASEWLISNAGYRAKHFAPRRRIPEDEEGLK